MKNMLRSAILALALVSSILPSYAQQSGGSASTSPSGAAGGSLAGTYPNPSVAASTALPGSPTTTTQASGDNSTKLATTAYVDTALAGINPAVAVSAATTAASDTSGLTYNNGVSGIGATFTGSTNTALTVDGFTFTATGQRLLVKNDTQSPSGAFNGVYYVTQVQTGILPPVLTRALDYDMPSDINSTGSIPVVGGTANGATSWLLTSNVTTVGTSPLTYTQFTYNPANLLRTAGTQHVQFVISPATTGTNGALTGLTAVTGAASGTNAFLWFPTNTIQSSQTAGWYYVQYTGTTTGTVFNNTYTLGTPVIPASPTGWVGAGVGAFTAPITEIAGPEFTIPANSMGKNGALIYRMQIAQNFAAGDSRTYLIRFGVAGLSGTAIWSLGATAAQLGAQYLPGETVNQGVANSQVTWLSSAGGLTASTIDTTQDQVITFTMKMNTGTNAAGLLFSDVDLRPAN